MKRTVEEIIAEAHYRAQAEQAAVDAMTEEERETYYRYKREVLEKALAELVSEQHTL